MHKSIQTKVNPTFQTCLRFSPLYLNIQSRVPFGLSLVGFTYILTFFCSLLLTSYTFLGFPLMILNTFKISLFVSLNLPHTFRISIVILFDASKYIEVFLCSFHWWCFCIHSNLWWWESLHILRKDVRASALIWFCLTWRFEGLPFETLVTIRSDIHITHCWQEWQTIT